jgi:nicotinate-nucleotide adenylyltransferase
VILAVLGGSFDPVHHGHVALGAYLLEACLADQVLVMPAGQSPHKESYVAEPEDRLAMCRLAFDPVKGVVVDDREILRDGRSFTVDTLEDLHAAHPDDDLVLVIGADNLAGFPSWRKPDRIIKLARLAVFPRDGLVPTARACSAVGIPPERVILVNDFDHPVSSTSVRAILAQGRVPDAQLPPDVARFIRSHHLYGV